MAFDFKKEYKEYYLPPKKPVIVDIPSMNYLAVRGQGNPNEEDGEYQKAVSQLYGVAYTLKMSYKTDYEIDGYYEYVVPPLEGLWWQNGFAGIDYSNKDTFNWIALIRLPDFVSQADVEWAKATVSVKKRQDFSKVDFFAYNEGLCVQCMHIGSYDDEPRTVKAMDEYIADKGYTTDITDIRYHHEIYLSDPRKTAHDKLKTVIRHPIKQIKHP